MTPEPAVVEPPLSTLPLPVIAAPDDVSGTPATRHEAKATQLLSAEMLPIRHARPRTAVRAAVAISLAAAGAMLLGSSATFTAMMAGASPAHDRGGDAAAVARYAPPPLSSVAALPVPRVEEAPATSEICGLRDVIDALGAGDDEGVIAAAGGADAFRTAVVGGSAPCVSLRDPARTWAVINKSRPFEPMDFRPAKLVMPDGVRSIEGNFLRPDAASALTALVAAAREAGVGEIAMESGFRSFSTQRTSYGRQVSDRGVGQADLVSARPGYSEHQSGMAADLVACGAACGTLDQLAGSPQGAWLAAHSWEYGWIVRYENGSTATTGYLAEPWHVRFIGVPLAAAYHVGAWHSLEEFFGVDPAPAYAGG